MNPLSGDGKEKKIDGDISKFETTNADELSMECENLATLNSFNEGLILHHVKQRFSRGTIYTSVGAILVAVNPYRSLPIYEVDLMHAIWNKMKTEAALGDVPPHVFAIGGLALRKLQTEYSNQSILISGESGAGKTETTKRILEFISNAATSKVTEGDSVPIETQILESNPILESFGNSKTLRNNNSSRFGKFMKVYFDSSDQIRGCSIDTYLLEKVRVVKQLENERSYHVFYMMMSGAGTDMKKDFGLTDHTPDTMSYLNSSGCTKVSGRKEKQLYKELIEAFEKLDFEGPMIKSIFQLLSAILHLGNVYFEDDNATDGSRIVGGADAIGQVSSLLELPDLNAFMGALCFKDLDIRGEMTQVALKASQATDQRDAVAKFIYSKVFDAIVKQVNTSLSKGDRAKQESDRMIGILDIFGFEVFQNNSFEQLCINYCNERLQTFFNEVIFKEELAIYEEEGVDCSGIQYQDNLECVRVIDGTRNTGIFSFLDEECVVPQGSDEKLLKKMDTAFSSKQGNAYSKYYQLNRKLPNTFIVGHFAGDVVYGISGFMEKNKDTLHGSMSKILESSGVPVLSTNYDAPPAPPIHGAPPPPPPGGSSKKHKITVSTKFKRNLDDLMSSLESTTPSFVRCIKPNELQKSDKWDAKLVLRQMQYSGLFEAIKIRRSGFAVRYTFRHFVNRYRCCVPMDRWAQHGLNKSIKPGASDDEMRPVVEGLLGALQAPDIVGAVLENREDSPTSDTPGIKWAVGKSKVFLRTAAQSEPLESFLTDNVLPRKVIALQRMVRAWLVKGEEQRKLGSVIKEKKEEVRRERGERELMEMEDVVSQAEELLYRSEKIKQKQILEEKRQKLIEEEKKFKAIRSSSALIIQKHIRGFLARTKVRVYFCESLFERALQTRSETLLREALHKTSYLNVHSPALHLYQRHAKQLIMEVLSESYIASQLKEAAANDSKHLIEAALRAAKESRMMFLPEVTEAMSKLEELKKTRQTLTWLNTELQRATSVPRLIESVDYIQLLLQQAAKRGLHHDPVCQDALKRVGKVKNLLVVRNKMRFHVETGSLIGMRGALEERGALVGLFGPELFQEEVTAIENMKRMIKYLPLMKGEMERSRRQSVANLTKGDGEGKDDISARFGEQKGMLETPAPTAEDSNHSDVLLPAWVRRLLILQRQCILEGNEDELNSAVYRINKLVPDASLRKHYLRIFKWNVAFCSWMPSHPKNLRRKGIDSALGLEEEANEEAEQEEKAEEKRLTEAAVELDKLRKSIATDAEDMKSIISATSKLTVSDDGEDDDESEGSPSGKTKKKAKGPSSGTAAGTEYRKLGKKGPIDKYGRQVENLEKYESMNRGGGPGKAFAGRKMKPGEMTASERAAHIRKKKSHDTTSAFQMATGPYSKRRAKSDITRIDTFEKGSKIKRKGKPGQSGTVDDQLHDQMKRMAISEHKLMKESKKQATRFAM